MGPMTDYLLIFVVLFSFWRGWNKGFVELLCGPVSLLIALSSGFWYYNQSHDMLVSLAIAIIGPIVLRILIWVFEIVSGVGSKKHKDKITPNFWLTSIFTSSFNAVWGTSLFLGFLVVIVLLPMKNEHILAAQKDIKHSQTYTLMQELSGKRLPEKPVSDTKIKEWTKPISGSHENLWKKQ